MSYLWYDLNEQKQGQIIEIDVATAVNVKLMNYNNFTAYRNGLLYRYYGGYAVKMPCHLKVPFDGSWILVFDLTYEGYFQVRSVKTIDEINDTVNDPASEIIDIVEKEAPPDDPKEVIQINKDKIFIVHGHDNRLKTTVKKYVEKIGFEPVILHEQANKGKTIIEKLEDYIDEIKFAIILYSPDDEMNDGKKRARQNVVFEHGLFIGRLSRGKVAAIQKKDSDIEQLSDLSGVVYIKYEDNWKIEILREL